MHYTEIAYVLPQLPEKILLSHVNDKFSRNMMPDVLWKLSFSLPGMKSSLIISLTQTTSLVHTHSIFVCLGIYYNAVLIYTLEMIFRVVTRPLLFSTYQMIKLHSD